MQHKESRLKGDLITHYKQTKPPTSWEEGTDHEAVVDGGHSEDQQEDKDQGGVTVVQHCTVRTHLNQ